MGREAIDTAFPFPSYREHQREALQESARALFGNTGTDTVVLDAPTGIGKSGINVALCRLADSAFYTTPQKQLRNQLETDGDLQAHYRALRARADYYCPVGSDLYDDDTEYNCETCPINRKSDTSCSDTACRYWDAKEDAMDAHTALLTFSYLIIDSRLPVYTDTFEPETGQSRLDCHGERQVSFGDRDLLVIDEAHKLEEQVASLHAGFTLSPRTLKSQSIEEYLEDYPEARLKLVDDLSEASGLDGSFPHVVEKPGPTYSPFNEQVKQAVDETGRPGDVTVADILPGIRAAYQSAKRKLEALNQISLTEDDGELKKHLEGIVDTMEYIFYPDIEAGRKWVVSIENTVPGADVTRYKAKLKPVRVDGFLQERVWDRADKVVLSTATMPYRNNPGKWLSRLGLDSDSATVVSKPMPFPPENRPVKTETAVGKMSNGKEEKNWDAALAQLYTLLNRHGDEKGLVHTASYGRAKRLHETFGEYAVLHKRNDDEDDVINKWQDSDKQMLFTPAMTDGVDLPGDMCRWQVLLKVPYPRRTDPRVEHLVNVEEDWEWYMDVTARDVIQSVGRAVRSMDDEATFYVLDASFNDVIDDTAPDWFTEAVGI
jgi:Rad3-related DNA helicase